MNIPQEAIELLNSQGFAVVCTLAAGGEIHCSAKGVALVEPEGKIYLIDLYRAATFENLERNPVITITVIDEHRFAGYALKGKAVLIDERQMNQRIRQEWERRILTRISKRVIQNIRREKGSPRHPESRFPQPRVLIEVTVEAVVDLAPHA